MKNLHIIRALLAASVASATPALATSYSFTDLHSLPIVADFQIKNAVLTNNGDVYYTANHDPAAAYEIYNGNQTALSGSGYLAGATNSGFVIRGNRVILSPSATTPYNELAGYNAQAINENLDLGATDGDSFTRQKVKRAGTRLWPIRRRMPAA